MSKAPSKDLSQGIMVGIGMLVGTLISGPAFAIYLTEVTDIRDGEYLLFFGAIISIAVASFAVIWQMKINQTMHQENIDEEKERILDDRLADAVESIHVNYENLSSIIKSKNGTGPALNIDIILQKIEGILRGNGIAIVKYNPYMLIDITMLTKYFEHHYKKKTMDDTNKEYYLGAAKKSVKILSRIHAALYHNIHYASPMLEEYEALKLQTLKEME